MICELIGAVKGEGVFPTSDQHQGIMSDKGAFKKRLFLRAKLIGSCLRVQGTTVTGTVLTTTDSSNFKCAF